MFAALIGFAAGMGLPLQTGINARLGKLYHSPFFASLINFGVGFVTLIALSLIVEGSLRVPVANFAGAPWWIFLGGIFGVLYIIGNINLVSRLGNVQTVIFPVLGQVMMGVAVDTFGWFDAQVRELTALRAAGALMVCAGVIWSAMSRQGSEEKKGGRATARIWIWRGAGLVVGMLMVSQTAVNSHLGFLVESRIYAALINCFVGIVTLIIINIVFAFRQRPHRDGRKAPPWIWIGGLFGILFIVGNIITAQLLGTGMSVIILLSGMTIGGVLADHFGLFLPERRKIQTGEVTGIIVLLAGIVLFNMA